MDFYGRYSGTFGSGGGGGGGVTSLNGETGDLTITSNDGSVVITEPTATTIDLSVVGGGTPFQETPTGLINNVNTIFTVSQTVTNNAAFELYLDGLILKQGVAYTIAGSTITMASAPVFGQTLYAVYTVVGGTGGAPFQEVPSGAIDGVNRVFMLSMAPSSPEALEVFIDGLIVPDTLYMLSGTTITMNTAPTLGQTIYAVYSVFTVTPSVSAYQEVPSGTPNGVLLTFGLSQAPSTLAAFELYQDGLILNQITDYSVSGTTITMVVAPKFDQTLYAVYSIITGGLSAITGIANTATINLTNTLGVLTADIVPQSILNVSGTRASPNLITAVGGIPFSSSKDLNKIYISGNGGPIIVTANPQIAAGSVDGQSLVIQSRNATNTVELQNGTGLVMNGPWIGGLDSMITFNWDTANWVEVARQ